VTHFAGDVVYRTEGWLKKNTDTLHEDLQARSLPGYHPMHMRVLAFPGAPRRSYLLWLYSLWQVCMSASSSPVLSKLFSVGTINSLIGGARGGAGGKRAGYVAEKCARTDTRGLQPRPCMPSACNRTYTLDLRYSRLPRYARQLEDLMRTLRASHSHFVRCVKPNHEQEPHLLNSELVLGQLRNSGMVDAVRLLSAGYSTRLPFDTLEQMFKPLAPAKFQQLPPHIFCVALLSAFDLGRWEYPLSDPKTPRPYTLPL
jgi:hypothetical protein